MNCCVVVISLFYLLRPLMVNTQRLSSLAFSINDGCAKDDSKQSQNMKKHAVRLVLHLSPLPNYFVNGPNLCNWILFDFHWTLCFCMFLVVLLVCWSSPVIYSVSMGWFVDLSHFIKIIKTLSKEQGCTKR